MSIEHWMMFGTFAEQRHFVYPAPGTYQGIIINGNMVAYAPAGLASFLLEKTANQTKYIVDPLTHAFQHDPMVITDANGRPKSSIVGIAEIYGSPISDLVGTRPLLPTDLPNIVLEKFVKNCIEFQHGYLMSYMGRSGAAKYLFEDDAIAPPYAVVPPYFYLTETSYDAWLTIAESSARLARSLLDTLVPTPKLFLSIVIDQGILQNRLMRQQIVSALTSGSISPDGFLLWVDSLDEQTASSVLLSSLVEFGRELRGEQGREVLNLHGGYFSILTAGSLGRGAMTAVAHGPEFGECRGVVPVGGGIPIARYYIPGMHARVRFRDAVRILRLNDWLSTADEFYQNVCSCQACKEVIGTDPDRFALFGESTAKSVRRKHGIVRIDFPTGEAKLRCLKHYLQRKAREYKMASELSPEKLLSELDHQANIFTRPAGMEGVSHLRLWHRVLAGV